MWASTYVVVFAAVFLSSESVVWSVLAGALCGALALEISVFKGGECAWLPTMLPTKALFHLLALVIGFFVFFPALALSRHGGLILLYPAFLAVSFIGFFAVHLREHAGPPTSELPAPRILQFAAALPFLVLSLIGITAVALIAWLLVRPAHP
jgi:hypothetical protein